MFDVGPINDQTWIVCGGRDFADQGVFNSAMGDLIRLRGMPECVVNGGALGADLMAKQWAEHHAIDNALSALAKFDIRGKEGK